ncbi:ABC transporter permease [Conexibacter woesei]|uniref:Binding-protein-dependent transport systems inner membrane component n=1 Tax=Conexibacter woesei (strain DSM 14684 / CCUG 47730 / CIP 108061 / JCM 11494 / NBRC 100937 / ID131577) TaxID=469383 RepID=D3F4X1_CONWI|nr:ABC transporter permease [Conexibacter woesei]ADB48549.1 binding-protein-dependent transport systems inner membrane component [Conexibacter woesei DSM 14684]
MLGFVIRRAATSILMLVAASVLVFVILRLLPGDPIITRLGATAGANPEAIDQLRREAGLEDPILQQYFDWVGGVLSGDFGQSYFSQFSVTELISRRIGATLELTGVAIFFSLLIAVPAAVFCSLRRGSWFDRLVTTGSTVGMALPQFLLGILLILVFAVELRWLPARGYVPFNEDPAENVKRMILPALTLAIAAAPLILRYLRASMIEVLDSSYIRTAEGKGVPHRRVVVSHALRNALIPGLTMLGMIVGYTLGGVVIVEYVFGIPGLGSLAVESVFKRDYAVLQSVVLLISALFIFTTLVVDVLYGVLDPRLRGGGAHG